MRYFISEGQQSYANVFDAMDWSQVDKIYNAEVVIFTGGADVSPRLYDEENTASYCDNSRDIVDMKSWCYAKLYGLPMIGICRGSQFINVMSGGKMKQDIRGHGIGYERTHPVNLILSPSELNPYTVLTSTHVNSTHHQESIPLHPANVLAVFDDRVVEAVGYPSNRAFGVQWHPEAMPPEDDGRIVFQQMCTSHIAHNNPLHHWS
tara:strand:- start:16587 stop:17204 length:618 start_codon:yes stop_codon:yes gene_type:complete